MCTYMIVHQVTTSSKIVTVSMQHCNHVKHTALGDFHNTVDPQLSEPPWTYFLGGDSYK